MSCIQRVTEPERFLTLQAECLAPRHCHKTIGLLLKHLIQYRYARFAQQARFPYFALNTMLIWWAVETGTAEDWTWPSQCGRTGKNGQSTSELVSPRITMLGILAKTEPELWRPWKSTEHAFYSVKAECRRRAMAWAVDHQNLWSIRLTGFVPIIK